MQLQLADDATSQFRPAKGVRLRLPANLATEIWPFSNGNDLDRFATTSSCMLLLPKQLLTAGDPSDKRSQPLRQTKFRWPSLTMIRLIYPDRQLAYSIEFADTPADPLAEVAELEYLSHLNVNQQSVSLSSHLLFAAFQD